MRREKTITTAAFRDLSVCRFQTSHRGMTAMINSVMTFNAATASHERTCSSFSKD